MTDGRTDVDKPAQLDYASSATLLQPPSGRILLYLLVALVLLHFLFTCLALNFALQAQHRAQYSLPANTTLPWTAIHAVSWRRSPSAYLSAWGIADLFSLAMLISKIRGSRIAHRWRLVAGAWISLIITIELISYGVCAASSPITLYYQTSATPTVFRPEYEVTILLAIGPLPPFFIPGVWRRGIR